MTAHLPHDVGPKKKKHPSTYRNSVLTHCVEHDARLQFIATLTSRFTCNSDLAILDQIIAIYREAIPQCNDGSHWHIKYSSGLAMTLRIRYVYLGDNVLLDEAISLGRRTISSGATSGGKVSDIMLHLDFATSLKTRYKTTGNTTLLEEAVDLERDLLRSLPPAHDGRALCYMNLADSLIMQYKDVGGEHLVLEAIDLNRAALSQSRLDHQNYAQSCSSLAVALQICHESNDNMSLLSEAIQLLRAALSHRPKGHISRAASCAELGVALKSSYKHTGDDAQLAEAIKLQWEALDLRPPGHTERAASCTVLASSLWALHRSRGDKEILTQTIGLEREALSLRGLGHPDRALSCSSLAVSLWTHYNDNGDDRSLIEALGLEREALSLRPKGHPGRTGSCANLAVFLWSRYRSIRDNRALAEAIEFEREGLELCPTGNPNRVSLCVNLGISLDYLYGQTGDDSLIVEAIALQREALSLSSPEYLHRPMLYISLAYSLAKRYTQVGDEQILAEAIDAQRKALTLCPEGHSDHGMSCGNLGHLLRMQYQCNGSNDVLVEAVVLLNIALSTARSHKMWKYLLELAWVHLHSNGLYHDVDTAIVLIYQSFEREPDVLSEALDCVLSLLDPIWTSEFRTLHAPALVPIYRRVTDVLPLLLNPALDFRSQLHTISRYSQVGSDAFVNAILAQEFRSGLEILEVVQGAIWSQRLYRRDPQLQCIPPALAQELEGHLSVLSGRLVGSTSSPQIEVNSQDALYNQSSRLYALMREIRALPGMDRFMLGEVYDDLRIVASEHPVVLLVGARGHYFALIMTPSAAGEGILLSLDLEEEDFTLFYAYGWSRSQRGATRPSFSGVENEKRGLRLTKITSTPFNACLKRLWDKIVYPVMTALELKRSNNHSRPRLHWCTTGVFSSLPLHAAGIHDGPDAGRICCSDYVVSSYTPTITTLMRVRNGNAASLLRQDLSISLVGEEVGGDDDLPAIPEVGIELKGVSLMAKLHDVKVVYHQEAFTTVSSTSAALCAANIVHLACHGIQDDMDATQSGFYLGDGRLTISHLMDLHIKDGFLAFLSACETAKGSKEQPDQAIHLAAAMLFTGFKNVVATIWAIADADGPCIAEWFYEELFSMQIVNADGVAHALDAAVQKLRASGVPTDRWVPFIHMGA